MQSAETNANASFSCALPVNTAGTHWVLNAAVHQLNRWVVTGTPPPIAPRLEFSSTAPVTIARDTYGNAIGGVRSPHVDAPIATLSGGSNQATSGGVASAFCFLFGTTVPFTPDQLAALYPSHRQFVAKWNEAAREGREGRLPARSRRGGTATGSSAVGHRQHRELMEGRIHGRHTREAQHPGSARRF